MEDMMGKLVRVLTVITLLTLVLHANARHTDSQSTTTILAWHDLPRDDPRSSELSGIAWDQESSTLHAISDDAPGIIRLMLSDDYRALSFEESTSVTVPDPWDGEGIARSSSGWLVSNENGPHIYELDAAGQVVAQLPVPKHFSRIRPNLSLEALAVAEDGRFVFTANEQALDGDGGLSTIDAGTLVRLVRHDRSTADSLEWAYLTDPVFAEGASGGNGVVELAALSPSDLLVMERSFVGGVGNSVRIYRVTLGEPTDIASMDALHTEITSVSKTLVLDLATLPENDFPPSLQPQPNRVLDNFEGLALGPILPDGRRVLFLISDDNKRATQIPRLLVLAVGGL